MKGKYSLVTDRAMVWTYGYGLFSLMIYRFDMVILER